MLIKKLDSGFSIPAIGLGTWKIGGLLDPDFSQDQKFIDDIKRCIDLGINLIDTAELYAKGHSEEIIGKAIKNYNRADLFITSKVSQANLHYEALIISAQNTLDRLHTDYLDLYLIHLPNPDIDIEQTMTAMNYLFDKGLIKNIGVSNFKKETLESAQNVSKAKIVLNQCHYNLIYKEPEISGLNEYCANNDIIMQAWRPIQYGEILLMESDLINDLSQKYGKTYSQIAINRLISQKNISTIIKMTKEEHIRENLGALGWQMEAEDIELLKNNYPNQKPVSDRNPLM